jgi:hypothetical protein
MAMRTLLIALAASLIACASAEAETPVSLSPSELTAAETATYQTLQDAPAQKSSTHAATTGFQKVLGGALPPTCQTCPPTTTTSPRRDKRLFGTRS